jgi:hypothetical protein
MHPFNTTGADQRDAVGALSLFANLGVLTS